LDTEFVIPWSGKWYLVLSNEKKISNGEIISLRVNLYKNETLVNEKKSKFDINFKVKEIPTSTFPEFNFFLPKSGQVEINIYSASGKCIKNFKKFYQNGYHSFIWDRKDMHKKDVPQGIYFVRFKALGRCITEKLILLR
jgi:flagellar hook assembly protein FlgD